MVKHCLLLAILHRQHRWVFFVHGVSIRTEIKGENLILPCYLSEWLWDSQKCMRHWIEQPRFITDLDRVIVSHSRARQVTLTYPPPLPPTRQVFKLVFYCRGCPIAELSSYTEGSRKIPSCFILQENEDKHHPVGLLGSNTDSSL